LIHNLRPKTQQSQGKMPIPTIVHHKTNLSWETYLKSIIKFISPLIDSLNSAYFWKTDLNEKKSKILFVVYDVDFQWLILVA